MLNTILIMDKHRELFQGLNFRITTKHALPYVGFLLDSDGNYVTGGEDNKEVYLHNGMFGEAFMEMSKLLNFTYTCREPPDNQYGAVRADGTWNGMVGQLATDNADIGIIIIFMATFKSYALILHFQLSLTSL